MKRKKTSVEPEFCGLASIGERGQIVIPKEARHKLDLKKGDTFVTMVNNGTIVLLPKSQMKKMIKFLTTKLNF